MHLVGPILNRILGMTKHYIELMCFNRKTIDVILQCHIRKKIYIASYNNTNINKLVNCEN